MLKAKRVLPSITPNLRAAMLPLSMKYKKPPAERKVPAEHDQGNKEAIDFKALHASLQRTLN